MLQNVILCLLVSCTYDRDTQRTDTRENSITKAEVRSKKIPVKEIFLWYFLLLSNAIFSNLTDTQVVARYVTGSSSRGYSYCFQE